MSRSQGVAVRARPAPPPLYRHLTDTGRRIASFKCREARRGQARFRLPPDDRWVERAAYAGLRPTDVGLPQARRLLAWARSRPARRDGRATRLRVVHALLRQNRYYPDERIIPAGGQQLADNVTHELVRGGGPPISRQTVQRILAEAVADGVLFVVRRGCSAEITGDHNEVSVYAVVEPAIDEAGWAALERIAAGLPVDGHPPVGVGSKGLKLGGNHRLEPRPKTRRRPKSRPARAQRPELYVPRGIDESRTAARWLIGWLGWALPEAGVRELAQKLRKYFRAGWCPDALASATQRWPDDRRRPPLQDDTGIDNHMAALLARLKPWCGPGGAPAAPPRRPAPLPRGPQPGWLRAEQQPEGPRPAALPATRPAAEVRSAALAAIAAGRERRRASDEAYRASKRLAR